MSLNVIKCQIRSVAIKQVFMMYLQGRWKAQNIEKAMSRERIYYDIEQVKVFHTMYKSFII